MTCCCFKQLHDKTPLAGEQPKIRKSKVNYLKRAFHNREYYAIKQRPKAIEFLKKSVRFGRLKKGVRASYPQEPFRRVLYGH